MNQERINAVETQKLIENRYNKQQKMPFIYSLLEQTRGINETLAVLTEVDQKACMKILAHMADLRSCLIETIIGMQCKQPQDAQDAYNRIIWLAEQNLLDVNNHPNKITVDAKVILSSQHRALIRQYQFLPPMICEPRILTHNKSSANQTIEGKSLILKNNHHEGDICLDNLNRMNSIAYSIDERVIRNIRDNREHLSSPKRDETQEDWDKRVEDFKRMERESMQVFALMINEGNRFYLGHRPDKRGRTYDDGYHINNQGNCYRKAIMRLADEELVE